MAIFTGRDLYRHRFVQAEINIGGDLYERRFVQAEICTVVVKYGELILIT